MKLGTVAKVQGGYAFKSQEFKSEGVPIIRIGNLDGKNVEIDNDVCYPISFWDNHPEFRVEKNNILIAMSGATVGKIGLYESDSKALLNQRVCILKPNEKVVTNEYLYFFCMSPSFKNSIRENAFGCAQPNISASQICDFEINVPNIDEQNRCVSQLIKIKYIINKRKQELEELDNLIKSRFVELFGDRFINDKNWCTRKLGECMNFNNGKAHEQVVDENGEYTLITSRAIASDLKDVRRTNELLFPLHQNDIVMVMSDVPNGRALAKCLLIDADERYTLNQRICSFDNYEFNPVFLVNLLNRHQYFLGFNDGNGQTNLRKNDILECDLIIPPMELQEQFAVFVKQVDKSKFEVQKSLEETQKLMDSLMQQYFG